MTGVRHIVALSGGKDSTAMALRLAELNPEVEYEYCVTPTGRELPVMQEHWAKLECMLGKPLIRIAAPTFVELVVKEMMLPNYRARFCTKLIKIMPFQAYALSRSPAVCYVGIRADEAMDREGTDHSKIEGVSQSCPMVDWGWTINNVKEYLKKKGVSIPKRTDCDCCFFQTLGEWWHFWRDYPDRWKEIETLETVLGHTLRSDQRDSWPASMKGLREKFEQGFVPMKANQTWFEFDVSDRPTMCAWCAR